MSWLISDSANANSTGHLSTYDGNLYYNQDSWRLCKNMVWVGPSSQKWQQSFDLDGYFSTDKDFGFDKKFNGFTLKTSADMPSLSQAQGSLPDNVESYKSISGVTTFSKDFTATQKLYKKVEYTGVTTYTSSSKHITFTAYCSGTITAEVDDDYNNNGDDCFFYILKNGEIATSADGDNGSTMEVDYDEGDTIEFKAVDYRDHSPSSDVTSNSPSISVTWKNAKEIHISYYNNAYITSNAWNNNYIGSSQNNPIIGLWRCKRTAASSGSLTMKYNTNSTTKTYYAAYVGGVLATSFISETVGTDLTYEVKWSDANVGLEIIFYYRPYFDGTAPKKYLEDEVDWVMSYCCKNAITSWDTNMSSGGGTTYNKSTSTNTDELGEIVTLSDTQTRTRSGYKLTDATSSKSTLPKINGLPYKGTTVHTPSYSSSSAFIAPNQNHRKSGHFVVTKDGTVSIKCALQSLTACINSYDNYTNINPSVTIMKNGTQVASYSNYNETKSYTTSIDVSAGDLISVSVVGIFTQNSYYELDYDDEVVDKCYLTGDKDETGFTVYKSDYDSANTPAYDMAFLVSESGTLEWSYNDVRDNTTSSSNDGILNIFVNGERKVRADNDNSSSNGSISLSVGDVVLVRYSTYGTTTIGNKDNYEAIERSWDTPGGQCTISFSGETVPAAFNHTLSWKEYCKLILAEARLWVDDNSLTDYALPIAIIDDAEDLERINQFYTELSNSKLYVDLWIYADSLTNLNASYVKCFNADMKNSSISTSKFEGRGISQVRIKDATSGIKVFKNTTEKIGSLELVNISGDWTEAFRNSVSTGVNVGKFTTSGLTSAKDMFRGCEIRYSWTLDEDKLKAFFNDTYDKWVAGEYDFRSAFVGSYHSGTIPEQFMSAEDQFACNWDPAILIQKVASKYDVSRQPLTCYYYAGDSAVNNGYSKYLEYSKTVHTIKLVSRQFNESQNAAYIYIDDKAVKSWGTRGHFVGVIDCKTMQFKYEGRGDTYGTPDSADAVWTAAIDAAGSNDIIVSITYNATSVTSSARNSINSCGGSGSTWTSSRIAHTFIGKKGLSSGSGYEGTASGSNYSTLTAQFDEDRGLVHKGSWELQQKFGLSPIYEKESGQGHFENYPSIIVPEEDFWEWYSVFAQIKSDYDCALFSITENNKANFNIDVYTSGDERQTNYNYDTSFRKAVEASVFDNLVLHLRKVENVTSKSISIEGMFKNIENLHCVGEIKNIQDITSAFEGCSNIIEVSPNLNNVEIADYAFKDCHSLTNAYVISNSCYTAMHMFENCDNITDFNIKEMTALLDATSMFEGCTAIKTEYFTKATEIPETLQVTRRMFAKCSISEISGNWVPPNSYTTYRNQDENGIGNLEDDWVNETTKEGWSFPKDLYDADQMFTENPITKISNLEFNPNANNSWIFSNCNDLTTIEYSFLNVDAYDSSKYTGMFDRCSLKKDNVIWLPISIGSDFSLSQLGFFTNGSAGNEKISYWIVDDHWCEVDHSGFIEYQHIRRPAYLDVYRKNYDKDVIIKFWSHPHIHSAEKRGYNELHDTKVYYDPETLQGGATINYNEWLKGKQTK